MPPLVLHVVFRFDTGGLENGVVNLINHMPQSAYRHAVVALTEIVPGFAQRINRDAVQFISLHKPAGHGLKLYPRLFKLFRELRPSIVHTRNLAALECQVPAALAGVPVRLHSEHGRDLVELHGNDRRFRWIRRLYRPFVHSYVALSRDLERCLTDEVNVPPHRVLQIRNGVDTARFRPAAASRPVAPGCPFNGPGLWIIGTVGRMQAIKNQTGLAEAFVRVLKDQPSLRGRLRLVMVGDGPLRAQAQSVLDNAGLGALAWLPGERADVPEVMQGLDCFVLPSLSEGISNTILEAMACGLPVIAADVGGNAELVRHGETGLLVPDCDVESFAGNILRLALRPAEAAAMGRTARVLAESDFSVKTMVDRYQALYDRLLAERPAAPRRD